MNFNVQREKEKKSFTIGGPMQAIMYQMYKQFDKNVEPYFLFQLVVLVVCLFVCLFSMCSLNRKAGGKTNDVSA